MGELQMSNEKQRSDQTVYACERTARGFSVVFSASLAGVDRICRDIGNFLAEHNLKEDAFSIKLGAREILNNAVVHGSEDDPGKRIVFSIRLEEGFLYLQAIDGGKGFNWQSIMQRHVGSLDCSGRGLSILRQYFDAVEFNGTGNEITLVYKTRLPVSARENTE